jgi:hypothetical protein
MSGCKALQAKPLPEPIGNVGAGRSAKRPTLTEHHDPLHRSLGGPPLAGTSHADSCYLLAKIINDRTMTSQPNRAIG